VDSGCGSATARVGSMIARDASNEMASRPFFIERPKLAESAAVTDRKGQTRFEERPTVLNEIYNLGRHLYLAQFADGTSMHLFRHEIELEE
jgi:hypothetical protein